MQFIKPVKKQVVCGSGKYGDVKVFWATSTKDYRTFVVPESRHIDEVVVELDDWIGYPARNTTWDLVVIGNKRCSDIIDKLKALWDKQGN